MLCLPRGFTHLIFTAFDCISLLVAKIHRSTELPTSPLAFPRLTLEGERTGVRSQGRCDKANSGRSLPDLLLCRLPPQAQAILNLATMADGLVLLNARDLRRRRPRWRLWLGDRGNGDRGGGWRRVRSQLPQVLGLMPELRWRRL